jgi:hypothetical protein
LVRRVPHEAATTCRTPTGGGQENHQSDEGGGRECRYLEEYGAARRRFAVASPAGLYLARRVAAVSGSGAAIITEFTGANETITAHTEGQEMAGR